MVWSRRARAIQLSGCVVVFAATLLLAGCSLFDRQPQAGASTDNPTQGPGASPQILSSDWKQTTAADFLSGAFSDVDITSKVNGEIRLATSAFKYASSGVYTSTLKKSNFPFNAVGIQWQADVPANAEIIGEIRTSQDGANYTDWKAVTVGADAEDRAEAGSTIAELVFTPFHLWVQYRLVLKTRDSGLSPTVSEVTVTFIDSTRGPNMQEARAATIAPQEAGRPTVIPRSAWGADESRRFRSGNEIWPAERRPVQKFIIHHTATLNDDPNPPSTIRAIYEYHASKLGWGDIGYNYLVDAKGNIFEGRFGGDDVSAGHAEQYNAGSMGISVLGNYAATERPTAVIDALVGLISWSAIRYGVSPSESNYFGDKVFANITGHGDVLPTSCPGAFIEKELSNIRSGVESNIPLYGLKWLGHDTPSTMSLRQTMKVKVGVSNRGRLTWIPRGEGTIRLGYHWYRPDGSQVIQAPNDDKRSELSLNLAFGQTTSIEALLVAPEEPGTYTLKWDMAREGVTWFADQGVDPLSIPIQVNQATEMPSASPSVTVGPSPGSTPDSPKLPRTTWYFAEGSTMKGYFTTFQLMNPGSEPARVTTTFMDESGITSSYVFTVKPLSRLTVNANDLVPNYNIATKIESDRKIYAERTMLFGHDGHSSVGTAQPAQTWFFAEGSTAAGFGTWLLLMNPNDAEARATVTFFREKGSPFTREFRLKPTSRLNVYVNREIPGVNIASKVEANRPIVAERSMYIDGGKGGHGSIGAKESSTLWFFAEGYTGPGDSTWLLLLNPNSNTARAKVTVFKEKGPPTVRSFDLAPLSRNSILVNQIVPDAAVSMMVEGNIPIVAERSMYFSNGKGAHNSVGANGAERVWYFPEGYTGSGVAEWFFIFNPEQLEANVRLTFVRANGVASELTVEVAPLSRYTLYVNTVIPDGEFATKAEASLPIVIERAIYFNAGSGGTVSMGIPGDR